MATNLRAPVTEDIWHLSIDDLLSPLPEKPRLGGAGPFVINLSSSTASIGLPNLNLTGCESAHAYEIQRQEDGRTRYRLRLGPFETEDAADMILDMVREIYPSALTATAAADDLKTIANIRAKAVAAAEARRPPAPPKKPEPPLITTRAAPPVAAAPVLIAPKAAAPLVAAPSAVVAAPPKAAIPVLTAPKVAAPLVAAPSAVVAAPPKAAVPVLTAPKVAAPLVAAPSAVVAAPPKAAVGTRPSMPAPVLDEAIAFNVDISFAELGSLKKPAAPTLGPRVDKPVQNAPPKFVEPPVITERAVLTPTLNASVVLPLLDSPPAAAKAAPAPAPKPATPSPAPLAASPAVPATAATRAAASALSTPVSPASRPKPASIWSKLPVAPRSPAPTQGAASRPSMSVSAPMVRRPAVASAGAIAAKAAAPTKPPMQPPAAKPAPVTMQPAKPAASRSDRSDSHISLESTQTMRALTPVELADENALPWFAIELATSKEAFDPDTVPNLDIFAEYRLYSVAEVSTGDMVHALRVGFFAAEMAAKAVASYLSEYYDKPTIKRVSMGERERFAEQAVEARKDVGATGRHAVIEITDDLVARRQRIREQASSSP